MADSASERVDVRVYTDEPQAILVRLDALAIADVGERPVYPEAKITGVRELAVRDTCHAGEFIETHGAMIRRPCGAVLGVR